MKELRIGNIKTKIGEELLTTTSNEDQSCRAIYKKPLEVFLSITNTFATNF